MMEFKKRAGVIIKERYGIVVEHLHAPKSYEDYFYTQRQKGKFVGSIKGFPMQTHGCSWCADRLKIQVLKNWNPNTLTM